jgi:hypothetical protein
MDGIGTSRRSRPLKRPNEADLKAALLNELRRQRVVTPKSILANEFVVAATSVRADLAILGESLVAVEVKSEADSLRRLDRQLDGYLAYFDYVILVIARRHLRDVDPIALAKSQVWIAESDGSLTFETDASYSPMARRPISDLLTKREAQRFFRPDDASACALEARRAFYKAFQHRFGATSADFWRRVGRRRISADDLRHLSRYREQRLAVQRVMQQREERWREWASFAALSEIAV